MKKKIFSQNGEDGIIEKIFDVIGTTNKTYVEFGVENGDECNTRYIREHHNWFGLSMDGSFSNKKRGLYKEFITRENIINLFIKYKIQKIFDLLSVDIDYNDFYVLNEILSKYKPNVIIIEINGQLPHDKDAIVIYDPEYMWDGTNYYNASFLSYKKMLKKYGYDIIYMEKKGVNVFAVKSKYSKLFINSGSITLFNKASFTIGTHIGHKNDLYNYLGD